MNNLFKIKVIETDEVQVWSLEDILAEINRDRSSNWTDYDESDWLEGWNEWVHGEFYELLYPYAISTSDGHDEEWSYFVNKQNAYDEFEKLKSIESDIHLFELTQNNEYEVLDSYNI